MQTRGGKNISFAAVISRQPRVASVSVPSNKDTPISVLLWRRRLRMAMRSGRTYAPEHASPWYMANNSEDPSFCCVNFGP